MIENCPTGIAYDGSSSGTLASYELPGQRYGRADYKTLSRYILPTGEMPLHVKYTGRTDCSCSSVIRMSKAIRYLLRQEVIM